MLNEWMEAEAYLGEIGGGCRIQPNLLTGKFKGKLNGLKEVLVVIARTFIFEHLGTAECTPEVHDLCIKALKLWCGFDNDDVLEECRKDEDIECWLKKYPLADCWLPMYYARFIEPNKSNRYTWNDYQKNWSAELNKGLVYQLKEYTYENVLAEALAYGSLKEYFLVFAKEDTLWESMRSLEKGRKVDKRTQQKILKFISAYLLAERFTEQKTVVFKKIPVLNWMGIDNDNVGSCFPHQTWKGEPFYERNRYIDFVKIRINEEFRKEYDFQLIEKEQMGEYLRKGYSVYKDAGHGKEAAQALHKINY